MGCGQMMSHQNVASRKWSHCLLVTSIVLICCFSFIFGCAYNSRLFDTCCCCCCCCCDVDAFLSLLRLDLECADAVLLRQKELILWNFDFRLVCFRFRSSARCTTTFATSCAGMLRGSVSSSSLRELRTELRRAMTSGWVLLKTVVWWVELPPTEFAGISE